MTCFFDMGMSTKSTQLINISAKQASKLKSEWFFTNNKGLSTENSVEKITNIYILFTKNNITTSWSFLLIQKWRVN